MAADPVRSSTPQALLWERITGNLRARISSDAWERWFSSLELAEAREDTLKISVPDAIHQLWIEMNYLEPLGECCEEILKFKPEIQFLPRDGVASSTSSGGREAGAGSASSAKDAAAPAPKKRRRSAASRSSSVSAALMAVAATAASAEERSDGNGNAKATPSSSSAPAPVTTENEEPREVSGSRVTVLETIDADVTPSQGLSPERTFSTFVVGANNQFAHAAATAVAQKPGRAYNPLFLYGGTGLGKTHLMQAIGAHIQQTRSKARVVYITSEEFTNQFIAAIQEHSLPRFRKRFRQADVLLIDDIQFLAGKERSQEEFFHTFNSLFDGNKQLVLSSDGPPAELRNLEARLKSRCEWGLTAEVTPPDQETRVAILRKRAESLRVEIPPDIIEYLAAHIRSNVRRLHGSLFRVASWISLHGPISMNQAEELLRDLLHEEARNSISIDRIQKATAECYDIRLADMTSRKRPAHIALARQVAMYLARDLTGSSYQEIGDAFGGRDHGTIMHACRTVEKRLKEDAAFRHKVEAVSTALRRNCGAV